MKLSRVWWVLGGLVLIVVATAYELGFFGKGRVTAITEVSPSSIPELVLSDLKGERQSLGQWRGKVLVVNYWATWCAPCREEMPAFSRLHERYINKSVQFVGISIDDAAKIAEFQKTTPVSYPLLIGDITTMENSAKLGNTLQALPFTAVFDREGNLAMTKLGRYSEVDLERHLNELISR